MNNIENIILNVLEQFDSCCLDNSDERERIAAALSASLITQSLQQLAALLEGSVEYDLDDKAVIYTDIPRR